MSFSLAGLKNSKKLYRGVCGSLLLGLVAGGAWGLQAADEPGAGAGVRGVVPATICNDLADAITALPENWKTWGDELAGELNKLYGSENISVQDQRKLFAALRARIQTTRKHLADPRYRAITLELISLQGELRRHVDLAEAALDTLEQGDGLRESRASSAGTKLATEATAAHRYLNSIEAGENWVRYLELDKLQGAGGSDPAATLAAVNSVLQKFQIRQRVANPQSRDFFNRFSNLEQAASQYQAAATAPKVEGNNNSALRSSLQGLLLALEQYDADHNKQQAANVRKAFESVRAVAPDGGDRIAAALRANYFNYNMRIISDEKFLNRFVMQQRNEAGDVVDCVLGAYVQGCQNTVTDVSLDLRPSSNTAKFDIVVRGQVNSSTSGTTDQAVVYTQGNHYFTAAKEINFNGDRFWSFPARINVQANNNTYDAETKLSWIPLLGSFARGIALDRAEEMRPESEAIAASRVQEKALPKFDQEVEKQFGQNGSVNPRFQTNVVARLKELGVYPDAKSYSTSETELLVATRVMSNDELGADEPSSGLVTSGGMTVLIHESLMNNSMDRMNLAGRTMTEEELRVEFSDRLSKLLNKKVELPKKTQTDGKGPATLTFDQHDPIRFRVDKGLVKIILRAGFKQEDKEDIPTQIVTIPLKITVVGSKVVVEHGDVEVAPVAKPESGTKQIARAGVIKRKLETSLPRRELDRTYTFEQDNKRIEAAMTRVRAADGWLVLTLE